MIAELHNFISYEIASKLALQVTDSASYKVLTENGMRVRGRGICKGIVVTLLNIVVVEDFLRNWVVRTLFSK